MRRVKTLAMAFIFVLVATVAWTHEHRPLRATISVQDLTTVQSFRSGATLHAVDNTQVTATTNDVDCAGQVAVTSWAATGTPSGQDICLVYPAGYVPFTEITSVVEGSYEGAAVAMVVGYTTLSAFQALSEVPLPNAPFPENFCSPVSLAPNSVWNAYVPTAAMRSGDFSGFTGVLIDPTTGQQFIGNVIPASELGNVFAWPVTSWQQVPGSLSQISVGSDGTVWGLSSAGQPYMFNPQTQTWLQAPGLLTQIAVGSSGVVWGLNAAGQIYRYDPSSQTWDQIPGILSQIAVGSDGDVWGINSAGQVFHFNAATQTWVQAPGALAQIAVGYDGAVWGINASQQVYRFNPGTQNWQQVAGLLKQVAVGGDGDAWGINSAGQAFHFNTLSQQWQNTFASLKQIAVGSASNVWGLDSAGGGLEFQRAGASVESSSGTTGADCGRGEWRGMGSEQRAADIPIRATHAGHANLPPAFGFSCANCHGVRRSSLGN